MKIQRDIIDFKVYAFDCGLLRRLAKLPPEVILSGNAGYIGFKGALAENAILQALVPQSDGLLSLPTYLADWTYKITRWNP